MPHALERPTPLRERILPKRERLLLRGAAEESRAVDGSQWRIDDPRWFRFFKPVRIDHYFDRVRVWSRQLISKSWIKRLERTGSKVVATQESAFFNPHYKHKLEIYQVRGPALRILAELPEDAILNYVEVAFDIICPDELALERLVEIFLSGFLQPHHREKQTHVYAAANPPLGLSLSGYTTRRCPEKGRRRRGFWFQWYIDKPSRITGEPNCFHFEGKHEGSDAVKRLDIHHPRDLEKFSFDTYFKKYVGTLYEIDFERLGLFDSNKRTGGKRKKPYIDQYDFNQDLRRGHLIYRVLSLHLENCNWPIRSLQRFVDEYGKGPFLKPYLFMFMDTNTNTS
ncbi:hypothetical protein [Nitrobacter sp.]|uniref:hypothetical protein n=1 Tax=Nitrobacter sp. TaxID=29420 RepID=UPI001DEABF66|nr:hypothetical protein [Nitrobacter sp.]MCB1393257.1 hypothetical protein [Nitrobacter sp.]